MSQEIPPEEIACCIDHTLLKPEASADQIANLCAEASQYHFASVCVNPVHVKDCARMLHNSADVAVCTVVGFPLGANTTEVKVYETRRSHRRRRARNRHGHQHRRGQERCLA